MCPAALYSDVMSMKSLRTSYAFGDANYQDAPDASVCVETVNGLLGKVHVW